MDQLFLIQLLSTFIIGGLLVAAMTFLAEKVSSHISGIILSFPSTAVLSYFFLGWTLGPEQIAKVVPAGIIPLGLCALFPVIYVYLAIYIQKFNYKKAINLLICFAGSTLIWLILSLPIIYFEINNLFFGIIGYICLMYIAHKLLSRNKTSKQKAPPYTTSQKIYRAFFVGFIITLVVFIGNVLGPLWGAVFAMFPVAFSSSMLVYHWNYEPIKIIPLIQKVAIGTISILAYSMLIMFCFPIVGIIWGTLIAYISSLIVSIAISKLNV